MKKVTLIAVCVLLSCFCTAQNKVNTKKVSKYLKYLIEQNVQGTKQTYTKGCQKRVTALVTLAKTCDAQGFFSSHACKVIDSVADIYIVQIPLDSVASLSNNDTTDRIEAERMPKNAMDVTPQQVNASPVYLGENLPQAFDGEGVVSGIFDCYYDFTHPAFMDSAGNSRIKYYYDFEWQNEDGSKGKAFENTDNIMQLQHSQNVGNGIHGTHVAGIMVGSPVDGKYQGMAPKSDIYLADFRSAWEDFENPDIQTSAVAVLGFKYIFDKAEQAGKPCVINFSSCESMTLTRQRLLESKALNALVGEGKIIVAAAGNEGFRSSYYEKPADVKQAGTGIINGIVSGDVIDIDLVVEKDLDVRFDFFGMKLTNEGIEGTISFNTADIDSTAENHFTTTVKMGDISLDVTLTDYEDPRGKVYHIDGKMPHLAYLVLCGATVLLSGDGAAYMYSDIHRSPFTNVESVPAYCYAKKGYSVSWPASMPDIIAAGATGYKSTFTNIEGETNKDMLTFAPDKDGLIAKFSSCGPTFEGNVKPDVVAPGFNINAAYCSFHNDFDNIKKSLTDKVTYNGKDYYYLAESGTSMASPVVAGTVALWLQANPTLTPEQVLNAVKYSASHPDTTLQYPNNTYGYGQIDAYKGLLYVLNLPQSIKDLSENQPKQVRFRLENKILYADFADKKPDKIVFTIYSVQGAMVLRQEGKVAIDISSLPSGIYAIQLSTEAKQTTGSTLIRL